MHEQCKPWFVTRNEAVPYIAMMIIPVNFAPACRFVEEFHRHLGKPTGHKFSVGLEREGELVGVAMVGRPISRGMDDGRTLEVSRCCTNGIKNVCSMLYATCWKASKALGYRRLITYTLGTEPGTSLIAAGFKDIGSTREYATGWRDGRPVAAKRRWELQL